MDFGYYVRPQTLCGRLNRMKIVILVGGLMAFSVSLNMTLAWDHLMPANKEWYVRDSRIHGAAVYAKRDLNPGDRIGVALVFTKKGSLRMTEDFGSFLNHCPSRANAEFHGMDSATFGRDPIWLVASRHIRMEEEITVDYTDTDIKYVFTPPRRKSKIEC